MKRIKDFLYNWNDIVIIVLILLAAASLISWRVNKIMDYPSTVVTDIPNNSEGNDEAEGDTSGDNSTDTVTDDSTGDSADDTDGTATDGGNEGNDGLSSEDGNQEDGTDTPDDGASDTDTPDTQSANTYVEPGAGPVDSAVWQDGKLRNDITVTTASGTAYDAVDSLIAAGLFTSFDDYYAVCMRVGVDSSMIRAATFTFNAGETQEDIVKKVTI